MLGSFLRFKMDFYFLESIENGVRYLKEKFFRVNKWTLNVSAHNFFDFKVIKIFIKNFYLGQKKSQNGRSLSILKSNNSFNFKDRLLLVGI